MKIDSVGIIPGAVAVILTSAFFTISIGVPEITPLDASTNPSGNLEPSTNEYVMPVPPVAVTVYSGYTCPESER